MQDANKEQPKERDLLAELTQATEYKEPSAQSAEKSWNFNEDEATPSADKNSTESTQTSSKEKIAGKLTEKEIKAGAEASASGVELVTSLLSEAIINIRYYKKFTAEEKELLNEKILDAIPSTLKDEETTLLNKWNRIMKDRDLKLKRVDTSDKERERLVHAFEKYSEITGETILTPGWMVGIAVAERVIKSGIEAFLD